MLCCWSRIAVLSIVRNQEAPFFVLKSAKKRPKIFFNKAPQFQPKAPQFETFSIWHIVKMTHHTNFIAFLCDNIYQMSHSNIFPRFFKTCTGKSLFWEIFLSAPKNLWRHKQSQKRHSGAKAPLLKALCTSTHTTNDDSYQNWLLKSGQTAPETMASRGQRRGKSQTRQKQRVHY